MLTSEVSVREYVEALIASVEGRLERMDLAERERIDALRREMGLIADASSEAIRKAEAATERRFEGVNEFREQLRAQAAAFLTREVFDSTVASWTQWRETVESRLQTQAALDAGERRGRESGRLTLGAIVGVVGAAVALLGLVIVVANALTSG